MEQGQADEYPDILDDERAIRSIDRRARAYGDAGGAFRAPLHCDPSRRGGGRGGGCRRHEVLGAGAPHGRRGLRAPGARVSHHSELSPGGDYLNGIG
jgi:hypothetical protein